MRFPISQSISLGSYIFRNKLLGKKRFPLVLMLEPLHACNLSCSGCGRIREYASTIGHTMSVEECVDASVECGAPIVTICGGEPLIYRNIAELIDRLISINRHIYLCTNGLALAQKAGELTPHPHLMLNIHLDGTEKTHDAIVQRPGAFAATVEGIKEARRRGFRVSTNTTVYKETDMTEVEALFEQTASLGVEVHMISPAYDYEAVKNGDLFLDRAGIAEKFRDIERIAKRFRLSDTPIYLDFLQGKRELRCAAWGNPTRNPVGWRSPCYMLADRHFQSFKELMEETDWDAYGPGKDERCRDCMVHCGFEPAVVLDSTSPWDMLRLTAWQLR